MRFHLSLKTSLALAFGLLALITAGQGVLSIVKLSSVRHSVNEVASNWLPSVVAVNDIRDTAADMRIKQLRLFALSSGLAPSEIKRQLAEAGAKLAKARATYEPLISSSAERGFYDVFTGNWGRYESVEAEALRLVERGQPTDALALIARPESPSGKGLRRG